MNAREEDKVVWFVGVVVVAAILCLFALAAPAVVLTLLAVFAALGTGWLLRKSLAWGTRSIIVGVALGSGGFIFQFAGGLTSLVVLALVFSLSAPDEVQTKLFRLMWSTGTILIVIGIAITASSSHIPMPRTVGIITIAVAFGWCLQRRDRGVASTTLRYAGLTAATGVFLSWAIGRPIFGGVIAYSTTEAGITRAAGFQAHPNEAAVVLSAALVALLFQYLRETSLSRRGGRQPRELMTLAVIGLALLMTGSRSALLGFLAAAATFGLAKVIEGRMKRTAAVVGLIGAGGVVLAQLGTFAGRSLNVLAGSDGSSVYRQEVQRQLWAAIDFTQVTGVGFAEGSLLAPNQITGNINNVDNAWLYMLISTGILVPAGLVILLLTGTARAYRVARWGSLGGVFYVAIVTSAENVWILTGTSVCVALAVVANGESLIRPQASNKEQNFRAEVRNPVEGKLP